MPGLKVWPSDANMVLVRILGRVDEGGDRAQHVFDGLKARGVLIKNVSKMHPLLHHCIRITVGTSEENAKMLAALKASL
jgi:histidinol-phosphate aminotransferase